MKKLIALFLLTAMVLTLCACGNGSKPSGGKEWICWCWMRRSTL